VREIVDVSEHPTQPGEYEVTYRITFEIANIGEGGRFLIAWWLGRDVAGNIRLRLDIWTRLSTVPRTGRAQHPRKRLYARLGQSTASICAPGPERTRRGIYMAVAEARQQLGGISPSS
jgi:hypothetical protein